ncbi:MAG: protein kinase domain-containing protein, partial [Gemmatimonadaceae bacterium]
MSEIGKYRILEQIGEGAMGVVYKATDPVLNRTVAIKVMNEGLAQDTALRERFLREAQSAGSLQHPNLVTIYDFGETSGHLYIAMEYIEGADLEDLLTQNAPMPLPAKLDLMIDVLNGLSFAHRRGVIHRDIKPANIRIDQEGRARIMDFGVAKMEKSNLTGTGVMMGTPNYMAPEQITGTDLTAQADLWSVGAVLYELLTNKKPFGADTLHRVLFRIVSEPPTELLELNPDLPLALDHVVKRALEKDPTKRYATASEFANALSAVRSRLAGARASRTVSQRSSIEEHLRRAGTQEKEPAGSRALLPVTIGVGVGVILATAGVMFALMKDPKPAAPNAPVPSLSATPPVAIPQPVDTTTSRAPAASTAANSAPDRSAPDRSATDKSAPARSAGPTNAGTRATGTRSTETKIPETKVDETKTADSRGTTTQAQPASPPAPAVSPPSPTVRDTAAPPVTTQAPTAAPQAAPTPVDHRPAIAALVQAYARSIGTRNVAEVRRVYVGMTPQQQSAWESFFGSV